MPRAPRVSGRDLVGALEKHGFKVTRIRGSQHMLVSQSGQLAVVPVHGNDILPQGTLNGVFKQAHLSVEQLGALLR